ncbi:MAG: hypothetical protein HC880_20130 [Bacteroidia bacterium]|nr:hypothetical protein [Bacteroidia bacterium]
MQKRKNSRYIRNQLTILSVGDRGALAPPEGLPGDEVQPKPSNLYKPNWHEAMGRQIIRRSSRFYDLN